MSHIQSHRERISPVAKSVIMEAIRDPGNELTTLAYEHRLEELSTYCRERQMLATPYYDELGTFLPRFGFDYRTFFTMLGTPCHWLDDRSAALADKLERLADDAARLETIRRCTHTLLPEVWSSPVWGDSPSYRLHAWRKYHVDTNRREQIRRQYRDLYPRFYAPGGMRTRINTEDLLPMADLYGIPYHWLLCIPSGTAVLASVPVIEDILDDFARLSDVSKRVVERIVAHMLETGRVCA